MSDAIQRSGASLDLVRSDSGADTTGVILAAYGGAVASAQGELMDMLDEQARRARALRREARVLARDAGTAERASMRLAITKRFAGAVVGATVQIVGGIESGLGGAVTDAEAPKDGASGSRSPGAEQPRPGEPSTSKLASDADESPPSGRDGDETDQPARKKSPKRSSSGSLDGLSGVGTIATAALEFSAGFDDLAAAAHRDSGGAHRDRAEDLGEEARSMDSLRDRMAGQLDETLRAQLEARRVRILG